MKFTIKKEEFLKGLSRVQSVADRRNTMPILSNVLIESGEGGITVTATDLEIGLRGVYEAQVEEPGGVAISARKLFEIVRELPAEEVSFETAENNWATIKSGSAVFKFTGLPKEDFPALPDMEGPEFVPVDAHLMRELIRKTIFAAGDNDTRYVLNGIFMSLAKEADGATIQMVGTDGHRLAVIKKKLDADISAQGGSAIIPKKSASELKKLLDEDEGELMMAMSKNHIVFRLGLSIYGHQADRGQLPQLRAGHTGLQRQDCQRGQGAALVRAKARIAPLPRAHERRQVLACRLKGRALVAEP